MKLLLYLVIGAIGVFMMYGVHLLLTRCYIALAIRSCRKRGFIPSRLRCGPAFNGGVKTEYSIVELDCISPDNQRTLVRLLVWVFGVRKTLSIEPFTARPEEDKSWAAL